MYRRIGTQLREPRVSCTCTVLQRVPSLSTLLLSTRWLVYTPMVSLTLHTAIMYEPAARTALVFRITQLAWFSATWIAAMIQLQFLLHCQGQSMRHLFVKVNITATTLEFAQQYLHNLCMPEMGCDIQRRSNTIRCKCARGAGLAWQRSRTLTIVVCPFRAAIKIGVPPSGGPLWTSALNSPAKQRTAAS